MTFMSLALFIEAGRMASFLILYYTLWGGGQELDSHLEGKELVFSHLNNYAIELKTSAGTRH